MPPQVVEAMRSRSAEKPTASAASLPPSKTVADAGGLPAALRVSYPTFVFLVYAGFTAAAAAVALVFPVWISLLLSPVLLAVPFLPVPAHSKVSVLHPRGRLLPSADPVKLGKLAVVVGGGFSGLASARLLARHYERVLIMERDTLPAVDDPATVREPLPRKGVPQSRYFSHLLTPRGTRLIEELWGKAISDSQLARGSQLLSWMGDTSKARFFQSGRCG
jgi:hypothetical protein